MKCARTHAIVAVILVVASFVAFATPVGAEERRGTSVRIPGGTMVSGDLRLVAGRAVVDGGVTGNLDAVAGYLDAVGPVGGTVTAVGGRIEVRGPVDGGVKVTGASVAIYGHVAGDVTVIGGAVTIVEGARIGGDLVLAGASAIVVADALVVGDVRGAALDLTVEGEVGRDVRVTVRRLGVAPSARIGGTVRYESRAPAAIAPGATIAGDVVRVDPARRFPLGGVLLWRNAAVLRLAAMLVVGAALVVLAPRRLAAAADRGRADPGGVLLAGAGMALFVPVVLLVLALAVVTAPLALVGGAACLAAVYPSQAIVGLALGRAARRVPPGGVRRTADLAAMAAGTSLLAAVRLAPVPYLSPAIAVLIAAAGLGMLARSGLAGLPASGSGKSAAPASALLAPVAGGLIGFGAVAAGLAALILGGVAAAAAVLVASNQVSITWTVAPGRLAVVALGLGGVALACALAVLVTVRRR